MSGVGAVAGADGIYMCMIYINDIYDIYAYLHIHLRVYMYNIYI